MRGNRYNKNPRPHDMRLWVFVERQVIGYYGNSDESLVETPFQKPVRLVFSDVIATKHPNARTPQISAYSTRSAPSSAERNWLTDPIITPSGRLRLQRHSHIWHVGCPSVSCGSSTGRSNVKKYDVRPIERINSVARGDMRSHGGRYHQRGRRQSTP